jgi:ACS family glucarate transporter-like MFS transporter
MKKQEVVGALFLLSLITYIDRVAISTAKEPLAGDLGLSDTEMGAVFSAFALGYALAQIPGGWLADRWGPRKALAAVVIAWSTLTALTGAAWSLVSLLAIRFLFGVGEAGAFPGSARAFYNWLPASERGLANGVLFSGSRIGAAMAFPLLVWMFDWATWRGGFLILGAAGVLWAVYWLARFRDHPPAEQAPASSLRAGGNMRLRDVFLTARFLPAMVQYFAGNFTFFICLSWMNPYLKEHYTLSAAEAARWSMVPLLVGATSQWSAGWLVDRLYAGRWRVWSRRLPAMVGFLLAAAGVLGVAGAPTPLWAVVFFTLATFGADMTISPSWSYCVDVAGENSGRVSAAMNMVGNFGSVLSANAFPWLMGATGSAAAYFFVAAGLNLMSVVLWWRMRSVEAR